MLGSGEPGPAVGRANKEDTRKVSCRGALSSPAASRCLSQVLSVDGAVPLSRSLLRQSRRAAWGRGDGAANVVVQHFLIVVRYTAMRLERERDLAEGQLDAYIDWLINEGARLAWRTDKMSD